ncbi:MAG: PspC domain-containing protein [Bifidobacterium tibiigranuli]|jgi:phage shock protein PspC (stress-responsive transcriptional regulator)|uniref:PspC domain-containing protein n=1 Tax=Bifidobacterium tibiigranuli TaxID=2172043 RepID=UPI0026E964B6|nr:PspC domain-containing protein [Bifidobacterium tibiigranuli]MCI1672671.1 PspC domain-containing protein [Bifidobacterium tibiigranuli]MCI1712324.1 PspC domain-containing protein [Bifidobacterium tibiigranuli]
MSNPYDAAPPQEPHPQDPYDTMFSTHARRFFAWIRSGRISRSEDRWVGGVCAGLAERIGWSPVLVRALMVASTVIFGFGLAFYALAWFLLPDDYDGRIMAQDLVNGVWRWVMLGPLAMFVAVFVFPGYGLFVDALALAALLVVVNNLSHREHIAGRGAGYAGPQGNPAGPQPNPEGWRPRFGGPMGGPAPRPAGSTGPASPAGSHSGGPAGQTGPASPAGTESPTYGMPPANGYGTAHSTANAGSAGPAGPMNGPTSGSAGWAPGPGPAASAASAYRRPVPPHDPHYASHLAHDIRDQSFAATPPVPRYARRKPAGFGVVMAVLGLIFVSAAALFGTQLNASLYLGDIVKMAVLWSAGVCLLIGGVIVVLGLMGRRSGGLIPLAWLAGFVAVSFAVVGAFYTYNLNDMRLTNASYVTVSEQSERSFGPSEHDMTTLKNGVAFVGNDYDSNRASIDLSGYAKGRKPHDMKLDSGKTVSSQCPTGVINLTAYRTQVSITLPDGCSYGFGNGIDNWQYYGSVRSVGGRYASMNRSSSAGLFEFMQYTGHENDSNYQWLYGDDRPVDGPELWINATHVIEARVSVRYASEPAASTSDMAWDDMNGVIWNGSSASSSSLSSQVPAVTLAAWNSVNDENVAQDTRHTKESATQLKVINAQQSASTKEFGHE